MKCCPQLISNSRATTEKKRTKPENNKCNPSFILLRATFILLRYLTIDRRKILKWMFESQVVEWRIGLSGFCEHCDTQCRDRLVRTPVSYKRGVELKSRPGDRLSYTEILSLITMSFFWAVTPCRIVGKQIPGLQP